VLESTGEKTLAVNSKLLSQRKALVKLELKEEKPFVLDQKAGLVREVKLLDVDGDVKVRIHEKDIFYINYSV
jgi:hypothetical protein